jgi:hypothetical protein
MPRPTPRTVNKSVMKKSRVLAPAEHFVAIIRNWSVAAILTGLKTNIQIFRRSFIDLKSNNTTIHNNELIHSFIIKT